MHTATAATIICAMKLVIFSPFSSGPPRGNIISVNRIVRYLERSGLQPVVIPLDSADCQERITALERNRPDLLHGFHGFYTGPECRRTAARLGIPYIITVTGSDLFDPAMRDHPETAAALHDASAIICFDRQVAELVRGTFPAAAAAVTVIPQGVERFAEGGMVSRSGDPFVILLPAALRRVKGVDYAIQELAPLLNELPHLQLWVAGGALERQYGEEVQQLASGHCFVTLLGEIPHQQMGGYYLAADLVLNCSLFEGGMANGLLEGMVTGRPVVARDIAGNRSVVINGETGWLFGDGEQLRQLVRMIAANRAAAASVARQGERMALEQFHPQLEAKQLLQLYHRLTEKFRG